MLSKKDLNFIFLYSLKLFKGSKNKFINILIIFALSIGLSSLLVIIGVMNGFQNNYITRRLEVGSFHCEIKKDNDFEDYEKVINLLANFENIIYITPFCESETIAYAEKNDKLPLKIKAIDFKNILKDKLFCQYMSIIDKNPDKLGKKEILIGEELARRIDYNRSLNIKPSFLSSKNEEIFYIYNYFNTNTYDYDRYFIFMDIYDYKNFKNINYVDGIGIKFKNFYNKKEFYKTIEKLKKVLEENGEDDLSIRTAYEINGAFFQALLLEKVMIILLFLLIFIMLSINLYNIIKLKIVNNKNNIMIMKAIGIKNNIIELIFIFEPVIIVIFSTIIGTIMGFLISYNITNIFNIIELVINSYLRFAIPDIFFTPVVLYDESIYYQKDFIINFSFWELFLIVFSVVLMVIFSSIIPIKKITNVKPAEINRIYEKI